MHIELLGKFTGNIFCNNAGTREFREWYNGKVTDFNLESGLLCTEDKAEIIVTVVKSEEALVIMNGDRVLYEQDFGPSDGYCSRNTNILKTQVLDYKGSLYIDVKEENKGLILNWLFNSSITP